MSYTYEARCYHTLFTFKFKTLAEAIRSAAVDLELGEAWPGKIVGPDGRVEWEQSGAITTAPTLKKLAQLHGVEWPDV